MEISNDIFFGIISVFISGIVFLIIRTVIRKKLEKLHGTQKLLSLISIGVIVSELVFLGINFNLFKVATEIIASVGVAFALVAWSLQNSLKNAVAGIGIYLNPEINIGDLIQIDENKGTIIEIHLTKVIAITDEGDKLYIPTQKFHEDVIKIYPKQKPDN